MDSYKVAVTSEDGKRVCMHFGQSPYFVIFTIQNNEVVDRELRQNTFTNHMRGKNGPHAHGQHGHGEHGHGGGHSCGNVIKEGLSDINALICGGIGQGAIYRLQKAGVRIFSTQHPDVDASLQALLNGQLSEGAEACKDHHH